MPGKRAKYTAVTLPPCGVGGYMRRRKSIDNNEDNIIGFEALYASAQKCKSGVSWKSSVAHYILNEVEETLKLEKQLKDGTYKARVPQTFTITHPKPRECLSIAFRDRVYQRSMNDNVIYPAVAKHFVYENMACQNGKGTDLARDTLHEYLRHMYRKHGLDFHVLQLDIKGYYPSMRHDIAKETFREYLDDSTYRRSAQVLDGQYLGEVGFNPGSQMVQIAGIAVLNKIDHYIKERLRIKCYIRFMDDLIILHEDKQYLKHCFEAIKIKLSEIGFEIHPRKSKIYPIKQGITVLGFRFKVTNTGKALMLISKRNVQAEKKKLRRVVQKVKNGEMTQKKADEMYKAWRNHASKGNGFKVITYMDKYYNNLYLEEQSI